MWGRKALCATDWHGDGSFHGYARAGSLCKACKVVLASSAYHVTQRAEVFTKSTNTTVIKDQQLAQHDTTHTQILCILNSYVSFDEALPTLVPHCLSSYLLSIVDMHLQYLS